MYRLIRSEITLLTLVAAGSFTHALRVSFTSARNLYQPVARRLSNKRVKNISSLNFTTSLHRVSISSFFSYIWVKSVRTFSPHDARDRFLSSFSFLRLLMTSCGFITVIAILRRIIPQKILWLVTSSVCKHMSI